MRHGLQLALVTGCVIGWPKYRLGNSLHVIHYRLTWPVGISTVFEMPLTVPLHSPNGRHLPAIKAVQGDCETVSDSFGQQTDIEVHVIHISHLIMTYTASVKESSIIWKVPTRDFLVMCHSPSLSTSSLSSARSLVSSPDTVITKPLNTGQVNWEKSASSPWTNLREMSLMVWCQRDVNPVL